MTPEEIDQLPAGREMDLLVETLVLRRQKVGHAVTCRNCAEADEAYGLMPRSTNISAAWEVLEKLCAEIDNTIRLQAFPDIGWYIDLWVEREGGMIEACGDTAPLAICRAALKAMT